MGFLNNSGDIILDAVLTDTGRMRLAKGDGSFKIAKFALGDDEIDYSLFNSNTGSAFQDLEILRTPILEAFTNNASSMKSKLLTLNLKDVLHLPIMLINDFNRPLANKIMTSGYVVACDKITEEYLLNGSTSFDGAKLVGILKGFTTVGSPVIRVDQGINNEAVTTLPLELKETQYMIEIDNRLGMITDSQNLQISPSYIDDDDLANYFVSLNTDPNLVKDNPQPSITSGDSAAGQVIKGPRGTMLHFGIEASVSLKTSQYLFNTLGYTYTGNQSGTGTLKVIPSNVIITGGTTGYSLTIPIAYVKYVTT